MAVNELKIGKDNLKRFYPLSYFGEEELKIIADKARINQMNKSDVLFKAGSNDNYVIYLIKGSIKLALPEQPIRQWVLSFPFPLRFLFASNPVVMGHVLRMVYRVISTRLIKS